MFHLRSPGNVYIHPTANIDPTAMVGVPSRCASTSKRLLRQIHASVIVAKRGLNCFSVFSIDLVGTQRLDWHWSDDWRRGPSSGIRHPSRCNSSGEKRTRHAEMDWFEGLGSVNNEQPLLQISDLSCACWTSKFGIEVKVSELKCKCVCPLPADVTGNIIHTSTVAVPRIYL